MKKKLLYCLISAAAVIALLFCLQRVLMPKYTTEAQEGQLIAEYYSSEKNHNVIFIGDCEVYENFSPVTLWENYGISSYFRGSPQQLIWQSYYLLEETLKYEIPEAVVFNVLSMKYGEPQNEAYNRLTLDGMKWSLTKIKDIIASQTEEETFSSYVFPILRFHARWSELTKDDIKFAFKKQPALSVNGYLMRIDAKGIDKLPKGQKLTDYSFSDTCWDYLEKMRLLCEENGIEFILIKAPSVWPYWYDEWEKQIVAYAAEKGLRYYNFLDCAEEIGIDYMTDTYDAGLHLNLSGAQKLSGYFGKILSEEIGIRDFRSDKACAASWSGICDRYYRIKAKQEELLQTNGSLDGFTVIE